MLELIHSAPSAVASINNTLRTTYFSEILHFKPMALTRFLTHSTSQQHIELVCEVQSMREYQRGYPNRFQYYDLQGEEPLTPINLGSKVSLENVIETYRRQAPQVGLAVKVARHSEVPLFYEAHFTIKDLVQLQKAYLGTKNSDKLQYFQEIGQYSQGSLLKAMVALLIFRDSFGTAS